MPERDRVAVGLEAQECRVRRLFARPGSVALAKVHWLFALGPWALAGGTGAPGRRRTGRSRRRDRL